MFTQDEIGIIQKLYGKKQLTDEERELLPALQGKLQVERQSEIPEKFKLVTGWANPPKDYPI